MSTIDLQKKITDLEVGEQFPLYTGVIIEVGQDGAGNDVFYTAGNDTGYVLRIQNPIGTQQMANNILADLTAKQARYRPYTANGAVLNPAAEMGDTVTVNGTDSYIAAMDRDFGRLMKADIAAPYDEELDHEYAYEDETNREFKRESAYTRSRLAINEYSITAEVERANEAEGVLSSRLQLTADAITSEVTRATEAEGTLSSRITQTAESITSTVAGSMNKYDESEVSVDYYGFGGPADAGYEAVGNTNKIYLDQQTGRYYKSNGTSWVLQGTLQVITDNLQTSIDQRLDGITLTASSSEGSSSFVIKDGSTTITSQTLDLSVKAANISGKLTVGQIVGGTVVTSSKTETEYYLSTSSTKAAGGAWSTAIPVWSSGKYIWTRQKTTNTYNDDSKAESYSPSQNGAYDANLTSALSSTERVSTTAIGLTQTIYKSVSGGTAPSKPTALVTETRNIQNNWTLTRPTYNSSYPALYTATQTRTIGGQVTCTNPVLDATTTVIDGSHITTGYINASRIAVSDLSAFGATIGGWAISESAINKTIKYKNVAYAVGLNAPSEGGNDNTEAISIWVGSKHPFFVTYGGWLYATNATIEGEIKATSGEIGGVKIVNGQLTGITALNIAGNTITGDNIRSGTITGNNIGPGTISGSNIGSNTIGGGNIGYNTITTNNTSSGINTNLGYAAGYGLATTSGTGTYPSYFTCGYLRVTSGISMSGAVYTPKSATIGGTTIHYLGY